MLNKRQLLLLSLLLLTQPFSSRNVLYNWGDKTSKNSDSRKNETKKRAPSIVGAVKPLTRLVLGIHEVRDQGLLEWFGVAFIHSTNHY